MMSSQEDGFQKSGKTPVSVTASVFPILKGLGDELTDQ